MTVNMNHQDYKDALPGGTNKFKCILGHPACNNAAEKV